MKTFTDRCDELRRRMYLCLKAVKDGDKREETVQRIAMYATLSAKNAASMGGALALDFLNDEPNGNDS